jgi:hypothetical protein
MAPDLLFFVKTILVTQAHLWLYTIFLDKLFFLLIYKTITFYMSTGKHVVLKYVFICNVYVRLNIRISSYILSFLDENL